MQDSTSKETHFRCVELDSVGCDWLLTILDSVNIVSESFKDKMRVARHRLVYAILGDELDAPGGIHALQLNTKTPSEAGLSSDHIITSPDTAAPSSSTSDTVAAVAQS